MKNGSPSSCLFIERDSELKLRTVSVESSNLNVLTLCRQSGGSPIISTISFELLSINRIFIFMKGIVEILAGILEFFQIF